MIKLQEINSPSFAMRFEGDDAWVEPKQPCINEEERTMLLAKWCARAAQCHKNITGIRLFIKKSYGQPIQIEEKKESKSE